MTPFEEELKKALARKEPGEGFVDQVLTKVETNRSGTAKARLVAWSNPLWRFASAAILLMVALISGLAYRQHERVAKGEAAKNQLLLAMRIAGSELHEAQLRVKKIEASEVVR